MDEVGLPQRTPDALLADKAHDADDIRAERRRRAEAQARTLPVKLAFPLVMCTLPSFVLLAIVPALLGAVSTLRGSAP